MQKIMFNDKYGLTQAVLEGRKTMTRRMVPGKLVKAIEGGVPGYAVMESKYKVGEVVAVAQAYKFTSDPALIGDTPGWNNKMFVRADLMPHQIRIADIQVMRLQDISDQDCLREGVCQKIDAHKNPTQLCGFKGTQKLWFSPRDAFASLIDKVSGKGTWSSNPWVFVYEFELVK